MMKELITVSLSRSSKDMKWGFKLMGGIDYGNSIMIKKVVEESLAEQCGLQVNDVIKSVNKTSFACVKLFQAESVIDNADQLTVTIERILKEENAGSFLKRRYQIAIMAFIGFFNIYAMRVNLSVAIVAMTTDQTMLTNNGTEIITAEFDWSTSSQGLILSSFFYGYIATQILGGWFATRFGGKNIYGVGVFVTALFTILTPWLARTSVYLLVLARVIEGFFEGVTYPAMHVVWGSWAPPLERSKLATLAIAGGSFGTVIALPVCGIIAEAFGWSAIFYIFGSLGLLWSISWCVTVGETPAHDRFVSDSEKTFIESSIGKKYIEKLKVPWKAILTSVPVWAIVIANFSENWGFYTLLTELPSYMNDVFRFNMHNTGLLSALPYLTMSITIPLGGLLADWLRKNAILNTTQVRRIFNCLAFLCQGIFLLVVAHSTSAHVVVACLTMALGFGGLSLTGFAVNHLDIGHQYAGVLYGISNTAGTIPGILSPTVTGFLVENKTPEDWKIVFYISVFVYFLGGLAYWFMASGEPQPWSKKVRHDSLLSGESDSAIKLSKRIHNI